MILVTGASGILGSYICRELYGLGIPFKGLVRKSSTLELLQDLPKEFVATGEIDDVLGMEALLEGVDTVIHCAGLVSFNKKDKKALYRTNVEGTRVVVNACLSAGVQKIIHISSVAALGRTKKNNLVRENTKWETSKLNTEYAKSKYLGELEVWRAFSEGINVNVLNPSIILAPYYWDRSSTQLLRFVKNGFPFYPSGNLNYVDIRDVADTVLRLYTEDIKGERYILNSGSLPYKAFFDKVAEQFGVEPPKVKLNKALAWVGWGLDNFKSFITGKQALVTKESIRLSFSKSNYDNGKSYGLLKQGYRPLEDTLKWVCAEDKFEQKATLEAERQQ